MRLRKYITEVLNKFYLLTEVPIQAFDNRGRIIGSKGMTDSYEEIFEENIDLESIGDGKMENSYKIVELNSGIVFVWALICPKNEQRGSFLIGPFTKVESLGEIPYKPLEVVKYQVSLLRMIWQDYPTVKLLNLEGKPYSYHVKKAIDYIELHYMKDLKLDDLTDYLNINKSYFCSMFKKETGLTFTQYLNNIRIENSKKLLKEEDYSVLDIALNVGFNNQNYYNIVFKKLTKLTPLEYRNKNIS